MMHKRLIMGVVGAAVVIVAIFSALHFTGVGRTTTAQINVDVAPSISTVTIDGKAAHAGNNDFSPGTYSITVSLTGFSSVTQNVSVTAHQTKYVGIVLNSNSPDTANWYQNHPSDQQKVEQITGHNFDAISEQAVNSVPLIKELPFIGAGFEFRIDYGNPPDGGDPGKPAIYIQAATDQAKQDALTWIRNQGYDPSKLQIVYQNTAPQ